MDVSETAASQVAHASPRLTPADTCNLERLPAARLCELSKLRLAGGDSPI
jgi:hypothetical protein